MPATLNSGKRSKRDAKLLGTGKLTAKKIPADRQLFLNRELSWLDFNARVFSQVTRPGVPLLERVKFQAIVSTNLDEFFMVRVAGLMEQVRTGTIETAPDGLTAEEQLAAITNRVAQLTQEQARVWTRELKPALARHGICILNRDELNPQELRFLAKVFARQVFPVLTPMGVDPAHPFPHLPNRSLSLLVVLRRRGEDPKNKRPIYAFVEVPQVLPRFVPLRKKPGTTRFILLEEAIAMHLPRLFGGFEVVDSYPIRVTRDSELEIDEEDAEDLLKVIEAELRERRWGNAVRLEISSRAPENVRRFLGDALNLRSRDVFAVDGPLFFGDFQQLSQLPGYPDLKYRPFSSYLRASWSTSSDIFQHIREADSLVHHPYESFNSVAEFLETASEDPNVLAIKITLYRTSPASTIIRSLMKAANNGKQVVALVELKARFDEANNIQWAKMLEHEGVHVVYGIVGLKTHCKACLVVRREGKRLTRYCHLSTGNYNPATALIYTDIGLFTADPVMCEDVANLFNALTGFSNNTEWTRLILSPYSMHQSLLKLIRQETANARRGRKAAILCKMNALVDPLIIRALYEASSAGVKVDLIVRSTCSLRAQVPGLSENIRVISVVGRFLEHSRIFCFGVGKNQKVFLSSADWMQRNFFRRIELMFSVEDPALQERLVKEILGTLLSDTANAWQLQANGSWKKRGGGDNRKSLDSQAEFLKAEARRIAQV